MGGQQNVGRFAQRVVRRQGLDHERVERGSRNPAFVQSTGKRRLIHQRAAGGVDEVSAFFHRAQLRLSKQAAVLGCQCRVQGKEIALGEEFLERDKLHADHSRFGIGLDVITEQSHVESGGAPGDRAADAATAEDAERLVEHIMAPNTPPEPGAHVEMTDVHPPGQRQQQREGEVGHGLVEQPGRIGDHDARSSGSGHVDGVVADAPAGNDLQPGGGAGGENRAGEFVHAGEHGIDVRKQFEQLLGRAGAGFGGHHHLATGVAQPPQGGGAHFVHRPRRDKHLPGH